MSIPVIVLAVIVLAAIVATLFCARSWHWGQVVLMLAIILTGAGYTILLAKSIQIRAVMGKRINTAQAGIDDFQARIEALQQGTRDLQVVSRLRAAGVQVPETEGRMPSLSDQLHELQLLTLLRGRAWRQVTPAGFDPATNVLGVVIEAANGPHGLQAEQTVFAFEQGPPNPADPNQGAQYLGEFTVAVVGEDGAQLVPAALLTEAEQQRIARSIGRQAWVLYESLPTDRHDLFERLADDQLRQLLPAATVEEYIRQGEPATADVDESHRAALNADGFPLGPEDAATATNVTYVYDRPLRDYSFIFQLLRNRRVQMMAERSALQTDNGMLDQTIAGARGQTTYRQQELARLEHDLAGTTRDEAAIEAHATRVEALVERARQLVDAALVSNFEMAAELSQWQQAQASLATP